jgi:hypothetical protein
MHLLKNSNWFIPVRRRICYILSVLQMKNKICFPESLAGWTSHAHHNLLLNNGRQNFIKYKKKYIVKDHKLWNKELVLRNPRNQRSAYACVGLLILFLLYLLTLSIMYRLTAIYTSFHLPLTTLQRHSIIPISQMKKTII